MAFSDVDWTRLPSYRKSTIGYCAYVEGIRILVSWKSKKQVVAKSSIEGLVYNPNILLWLRATNELVWTYSLLKEIGIKTRAPLKLWRDRVTIN